ncbi:LOW QUALITY PROTEIN: hypothetical protein Cgig2_030556 [Carnegiea gigantea]|uniref:Uncharacterized protein n=1 Tax=Carnegiea gigantea TaxID=171969 RepID=A0A9Q1GRF4_9CARY|nr:LOW QUALITY PROTEIN: hypothetical protein Cgig2_030556 [Carnegiea gigantea]
MAGECYLVSNRPPVDRSNERQSQGLYPRIRSYGPCLPLLLKPWRGLLITWTGFISRRRDKVHQLRILSLGLDLSMILYILDICLEVALLVESVRGQGCQEFTKELCTVLMPPPVALILGFGHLFTPRCGLGLYSGVGFFPLTRSPFRPLSPLSLSAPSASGVYTWPQSLLIFALRLEVENLLLQD